jgi:hypothetical protein
VTLKILLNYPGRESSYELSFTVSREKGALVTPLLMEPSTEVPLDERNFRAITSENSVEMLVDGEETFRKYFEVGKIIVKKKKKFIQR